MSTLTRFRVASRQTNRYVVILSPERFNQFGTPLVCPITMGGSAPQGFVLCNQPRTMDLFARKARFVERLPAFLSG
jgi:mRNA-degrading endonuclease toxin of MazEF toxin-antitoxin module